MYTYFTGFVVKEPIARARTTSRLAALTHLGGARRVRTADPLLAKQVLSRLSYGPLVGLGGVEPPTSPLSGVRSNRLSYRPKLVTLKVVCVGAHATLSR